MTALSWHRFQFAFTVTYHYLFPQLTMGLALLIVIFKILGRRSRDARYDDIARFWARIFGVNFAFGVVTGIPLEFEFGTNWARFSDATGGVIGLTLALEGMFAFFAESAFLGLFLYGERKLGPRGHMFSAVMVFLGSWMSGYFIVVTNAFMQHPVGYAIRPDGRLELIDAAAYLFNSWALWEYAHTMCAAVITGGFVVAAVAAYWLLMSEHVPWAKLTMRVAVVVALIASVLQLFPTGDRQGKFVAEYQRPALAAMEGKFASGSHAELALIGQPNVDEHRLENPLVVPHALSFLAYGSFGAIVKGLDDIPRDDWPDNIELLYYSYHVMVGLGTLLIALSAFAVVMLRLGRLYSSQALLWALMLAAPFPYIATTAGWMTAELGRQPWIVYRLVRTAEGASPNVSTGDVAFTTIGFMGLYLLLGITFLFLVVRIVAQGPQSSLPEKA